MLEPQDKMNAITIFANNTCNLNCRFCAHGCNRPIAPDNLYITRRKRWTLAIEELEQFCKAMGGLGRQCEHVLEGGEITTLPPSYVRDLVEMLSAYRRRVVLLSNGFNVHGLPDDIWDHLYRVDLDDHGTNTQAVDHARRHLKDRAPHVPVRIMVRRRHYDILETSHHAAGRRVGAKLDCGL